MTTAREILNRQYDRLVEERDSAIERRNAWADLLRLAAEELVAGKGDVTRLRSCLDAVERAEQQLQTALATLKTLTALNEQL